MTTYKKLRCIEELLRDTRDDQTEIPCKPDNCVCNDFDSIIDQIEKLREEFPTTEEYNEINPIHSFAMNYLNKIIDSYDNLIGDCGFDREAMKDWIRSWGNGGGMSSIEYIFNEAIEQAETISELLQMIKDDSYCESGTAILIGDIITALLEDECKEEINATIPRI